MATASKIQGHKLDCLCTACTCHRASEARLAAIGRNPEAFVEKKDKKSTKVRSVNNEATRRIKQRVADILALRATDPGISKLEIAKKLGVCHTTINHALDFAAQNGWITLEDPIERVRHEIVPKTIDNINHFLDAKDKQVTIEVAKGTIFKMFQTAEGLQDEAPMVLALKIEMPPTGDAQGKIIEGQVIGKPKQLEGDS